MESIPTDNARLTAAIRDGSREAFDEMCGRYYAPLMAYARLFLKGNWAQDIVQDVFVNVWIRREGHCPAARRCVAARDLRR